MKQNQQLQQQLEHKAHVSQEEEMIEFDTELYDDFNEKDQNNQEIDSLEQQNQDKNDSELESGEDVN